MAYLLRGKAAVKVNRWRREHDPRTAAASPAHVTLAGPVNTPAPLDALVRVVRAAADQTAPFELRIGSVATFLPVSATTFLEIEPRGALTALHDLLVPELGWAEAYPYHPHVTVTEYLDRADTEQVYHALRAVEVRLLDRLDRLTLLERQRDGRWIPLAEALLRERC